MRLPDYFFGTRIDCRACHTSVRGRSIQIELGTFQDEALPLIDSELFGFMHEACFDRAATTLAVDTMAEVQAIAQGRTLIRDLNLVALDDARVLDLIAIGGSTAAIAAREVSFRIARRNDKGATLLAKYKMVETLVFDPGHFE